MTSPAFLAPLLQTVDHLLVLEGVNPREVEDDDKIAIATQIVCVAAARLVYPAEFKESA